MNKSLSLNTSDSHQNFSGGSILCCDLTTNSNLRQCNRRFLGDCEDQMAGKFWQSIQELGIHGSKNDEVYEW